MLQSRLCAGREIPDFNGLGASRGEKCASICVFRAIKRGCSIVEQIQINMACPVIAMELTAGDRDDSFSGIFIGPRFFNMSLNDESPDIFDTHKNKTRPY